MSKARDLANLMSAGSSIADGSVSVDDLTDVTATATELNYVSGVTSSVQTQLNTKADTTSLSTVATSGAYSDLSGTPTIPTDFVSAASGGTFSGAVTVSGEFVSTSYNETYAALSGATPTVNCETGNMFALSTTGNTTFTFSNPPASGTAYGFTLKIVQGGTYTLTWPASVDWAGGTAPNAPASGETNVLVFITHDGGTTWYGFTAGQAMG